MHLGAYKGEYIFWFCLALAAFPDLKLSGRWLAHLHPWECSKDRVIWELWVPAGPVAGAIWHDPSQGRRVGLTAFTAGWFRSPSHAVSEWALSTGSAIPKRQHCVVMDSIQGLNSHGFNSVLSIGCSGLQRAGAAGGTYGQKGSSAPWLGSIMSNRALNFRTSQVWSCWREANTG